MGKKTQITESVNFNKLQSAYWKHHLTETALLIMNDAYGHIDKGRQSTVLVALDLMASFDTVEQSTLPT